MSRRLTFTAGSAAACALVVGLLAGAGKRPSPRLRALVRRSSGLPGLQQWARGPAAAPAAGGVRNAVRQAVARVGATSGARETASGGAPATSGGVIPLESVPMDQLSEWELDLLTTPDP